MSEMSKCVSPLFLSNDLAQVTDIVIEGSAACFGEANARARFFPNKILFDFKITGLL